MIQLLKDIRRKQLLSDQLRSSLRSIAHALRIGASLPQALEHAAKEGDMPLAGEWRRLLQSFQLGISWHDALASLAQRADIPEMNAFATAVDITHHTGGALADVLEKLAQTLEERHALRQKVKALTAQGKASGILLSVLPFVLLAILTVLIPDLTRSLYTTRAGHLMIVGMIVSICLGGLVIWKIVHVSVDTNDVLPSAIDLLALVMKAGLDFQVALAHYVASAAPSPIKTELDGLQRDMRTGSSRVVALRRLVERTQDRDLRETARAVIQGIELGSSLGPVLQAQSHSLRQAQAMEAERRAALAPLKLMFPLFVFIFPTIFIVLFGPVVLAGLEQQWF